MNRAAVLLIVGTLMGTPVADLACISLCQHGMSGNVATCHHNMAAAMTVGIKDADDSCAKLLVSSPFLKEEVQLPAWATMPASAPHAVSPGPGEPLLATAHRIDVDRHAFESVLVLRL